ncbi:MAG: glycosyltransferase family 4 protein [Fimbriiglobus sp.]
MKAESLLISRHFITTEYPPHRGGVGDYTANVVAEFERRGENVHVWFPQALSETLVVGERLHPLVGGMSLRNLWKLHQELNQFPRSRHLFLQYVPHGFGWKAMNLPFVLWLAWRVVVSGDRLDTMFHEVAYPWVRRPLHQNLIALLNRVMAFILSHVSTRLFVSIPGWTKLLRRFGVPHSKSILVLPVPSNIPKSANPDAVVSFRNKFIQGQSYHLVGHFGTYGPLITRLLKPVLTAILSKRADTVIILLGSGGVSFRKELLLELPLLSDRIVAFGEQSQSEIADSLAACDVVVQPYPDGASCRRTTLMASLLNGRAVVTTLGDLSEPVWSEGHVAAVPVGDIEAFVSEVQKILDNAQHRKTLELAAERIYEERFTVARTVDAMMAAEIDLGVR